MSELFCVDCHVCLQVKGIGIIVALYLLGIALHFIHHTCVCLLYFIAYHFILFVIIKRYAN